MPNWCEGTIKIRGDKNKVKNFPINGVNRYKWDFETHESKVVPKEEVVHVTNYDDYTVIEFNDVYIEDTRRAFIDNIYAELGDEDEVCVVGDFRQAWTIDSDEFDKLKDKWDVDFRVFGVECGMEFTKEVIAERGKPVEVIVTEYADWNWECPFPQMGG